jgi:hypothetical protein
MVMPGQALLALMKNTVVARLRPATSLKYLQQEVLGSTVLQGSRGEAHEIAERLLNGGWRNERKVATKPERTTHPFKKCVGEL